jgi:hypothetical protein
MHNILALCSFLENAFDLLQVRLVCRQWSVASIHDELWKPQFVLLYLSNARDHVQPSMKYSTETSVADGYQHNRRDATGNIMSWYCLYIRLQQEARKIYSIPIARSVLEKAFRVSGLRLRNCFTNETRDCSLYLTKTHVLLFVFPGLVCSHYCE